MQGGNKSFWWVPYIAGSGTKKAGMINKAVQKASNTHWLKRSPFVRAFSRKIRRGQSRNGGHLLLFLPWHQVVKDGSNHDCGQYGSFDRFAYAQNLTPSFI